MIDCLKDDFPRLYETLVARPEAVEQILPPMTNDEIQAMETALNVVLPESYKQFLRCARGFWLMGGAVQLSVEHPFFHDFPVLEQLTPRQVQTLKVKGGGWPPPSQGMLCFAEYFLEADGDQVLFDTSVGLSDGEYPVMYYSHEDSPPSVRKIAGSFAEWLEQLSLGEDQDEYV